VTERSALLVLSITVNRKWLKRYGGTVDCGKSRHRGRHLRKAPLQNQSLITAPAPLTASAFKESSHNWIVACFSSDTAWLHSFLKFCLIFRFILANFTEGQKRRRWIWQGVLKTQNGWRAGNDILDFFDPLKNQNSYQSMKNLLFVFNIG